MVKLLTNVTNLLAGNDLCIKIIVCRKQVYTMNINPITTNFNQSLPPSKEKKDKFLEKFHTAVKNSADMTDTIVVPRTIFKGYLGIMTGTTLLTIGGLLAQKMKKTSLTLSLAGLLTSLYGTYAFVRPFIIKDAPGVEKKKV